MATGGSPFTAGHSGHINVILFLSGSPKEN